MAKAKNNAASSALAAMKGKKAVAKPKGKAGKKPAPKAKAAGKPKAKKVKPQIVHKPKVVVPPMPTVKPAADVYTLVHQCWTLMQSGAHPMDAAQISEFAMIANVVSAYGAKLAVPTARAAVELEKFRKFLAGEKEPEPAKPKPWEPAPEAVQRLIAGECEPGRATWILHGSLWEFETGWTEPRRRERTEPEDWSGTGAVTPLVTPEGQTNEVKPSPEPNLDVDVYTAEEAAAAPVTEPESVAETVCVSIQAAAEQPEPVETAAAPSDDVDL